jgi:hypothetical protein
VKDRVQFELPSGQLFEVFSRKNRHYQLQALTYLSVARMSWLTDWLCGNRMAANPKNRPMRQSSSVRCHLFRASDYSLFQGLKIQISDYFSASFWRGFRPGPPAGTATAIKTIHGLGTRALAPEQPTPVIFQGRDLFLSGVRGVVAGIGLHLQPFTKFLCQSVQAACQPESPALG